MFQQTRTIPVFPGEIYVPHAFRPYHTNKSGTPEKASSAAFTLLPNESLRIILADDDADDREMFAEALEKMESKIKLECAQDGNELLNMLKATDKPLPHLVFLDLNMPNMNGKECLDEIRKTERLKHIPVIIYSTSLSIRDIDETFEKGANLYVRKPASFNDLLMISKKILTLNWDKHKPDMLRSNFLFSIHITR